MPLRFNLFSTALSALKQQRDPCCSLRRVVLVAPRGAMAILIRCEGDSS